MTLDDLERNNRGFYGFYGDFRLRHNSIAFARCRHAIFSQYWWNSCIGYGARRHPP